MNLRRGWWLLAALSGLPAAAAPTGPMPAPVEAAAKFHAGVMPAWVQDHIYDTRPGDPAQIQGFGIEYLLLDHQARAGARTGYFTRVVARVLTVDGVDQLGELSVNFHPSYQSLTWHWLRVVRDGRQNDQFDASRVRLLQRETEFESRVYDGSISAVYVVEDLRPGDIVDYAFTIDGENPIMGGRLAVDYPAAMDRPVRFHVVRALSPADRPLHVQARAAGIEPLVGGSAVPPAPVVSERLTPEGREYFWEGRDLPAIEAEDDAPEWFTPYSEIEFSEFPSWAAVVDWARHLYDLDPALPPDLEARLEVWKKEAATPAARAERAIRFVQDEVRYFAIAAGENSHRPNPPAVVSNRRFGDCKDKTALTVALLQRLGLKAWPALVDSRGGPQVTSRLPSPYAFDHVITAFELGGRLHWVDPTIQRQGGTIESNALPPYDSALLVRAGETGFTAIPRAAYREPLRTVHERFTFPARGDDARLEVETVFSGPEADDERDLLARTSRARLALRSLNNYVRQYPGAELAAEPVWTDDRPANRIVLREAYTLRQAWRTVPGEKTRAFEFGAVAVADYVHKPRALRRRTPLDCAWPVHVHETIEAVLPDGWDVKPEKHHVNSSALEFASKAAVAGTRLTLDFSLQAKNDFVPPAAMRAHLAALDEIEEQLSFTVGMERTASRHPSSRSR